MSGLLDAGQLAMVRGIATANLNAQCTICAVSTDAGSQSWAIGVPVRCMVGNPGRGGDLNSMYAGDAPLTRFWFAVGTVIKPGDRVVWNERTYKVEEIPSLHASEILRPVDCIEVREPGGAVE